MILTTRVILLQEPGGPEQLELVERPLSGPGPDEVIIRTVAMGVSRPDILIRKGIYTWMPPLPVNPGNELTGIIEAVGVDVESLVVGQKVLLSARDLPFRGGCYADVVCVPAAAVYVLPRSVDLDEAVVLPTYLVAYAMLDGIVRKPGAQFVYISGVSGGIGVALAQLCKAKGLSVIGSAGSEDKAAYARNAGADYVLNYQTENVVQRTLEITGGRGVDIAFDHIIGQRFSHLLEMLGDFGTLIFFNIHAQMPEEDVFRKMCTLSTRSLSLRCFNIHTYDRHPADRRQLMHELISLLAERNISPSIGARLPMVQVAEAHRLLEAGSVLGKILLTTRG